MNSFNPHDDMFLSRSERAEALACRGGVVWFYGLSGSGKTTIASSLEARLVAMGKCPVVLDGDRVRLGLCQDLGFSDDQRKENVRRVAEIGNLLAQQGFLVLVSLITPLREFRSLCYDIIGNKDCLQVFVNAPFDVCAKRDVKGLYAKAEKGGVAVFSGKDSVFEEPLPEEKVLTLNTVKLEVRDCVDIVLTEIEKVFF